MPSFTAKGHLHEIFDTQQVSEKFAKREFVLEIQDGQYPQQIKMQFTQDKCDLLDNYRIGDEVEISFNLRGRPAKNKANETIYYNSLDAWKIQPVGTTPHCASQPAARPAAAPIASDDDNDLPF